jgi:hypothetical protein
MLKACLIAPAVALLLGGAVAAQPMPLPPSMSDTPAAAKPKAKKAAKPQASRRSPAAPRSGSSVDRSSQSTSLKPFDRRDIADPQFESRFQPQLTPGGGIGMGGRF